MAIKLYYNFFLRYISVIFQLCYRVFLLKLPLCDSWNTSVSTALEISFNVFCNS